MTRDEAVLSIAKDLCSSYGNCKGCGSEGICDVGISAQVMHDRGYRKQSEGRWKGVGLGDYYCSICQTTFSGGDEYNFCPHCGAKMKGD